MLSHLSHVWGWYTLYYALVCAMLWDWIIWYLAHPRWGPTWSCLDIALTIGILQQLSCLKGVMH